jgi:hypothetical protein
MKTTMSLAELKVVNNNYYSGDCHFVKVAGKDYSFIKGLLDFSPRQFGHSKYSVRLEKQSAAYFIRDLYSGSVYVGSSGNIYKRITKHKIHINNRKHDNINFTKLLQSGSLKLFELIIIFTDSREAAYDVEQILVNDYKDYVGLLNIANDVRTARLGAKNSEEHNRILSEVNRNRLVDDKARQRMSIFHKTNERAISQFKALHEAKRLPVMVHGVRYESVTEAIGRCKYSKSMLQRILHSKRDTEVYFLTDKVSPSKGKTQSEEAKKKLSEFRKNDPKAIAQLESIRELARRKIILNGVLYPSVSEAVRITGMSESGIHRQLALCGGKDSDGPYVLNYVVPKPMQVSINGVVYESRPTAAIALGVNKSTLKGRLRSESPMWKDYFYVRPQC